MVYCPHCGVQNRDGSKFCNNCGARFVAEEGLRCPMCSTLNSTENVFCSSCGARLVPLVATPPTEPKAPPPVPIKGLSLPAKPVSPPTELETPKAETPKIEAQVEVIPLPKPEIAEPAEPLSTQPSIAETTPSIEQGEIPDWIARLRASTSGESMEDDGIVVEDIPDWLKVSSEATPVVSQPEPQPEFESEPEPAPLPTEPLSPVRKIDVPDWLSQVEMAPSKTDSSEPSVEPIASEDELPAWLKQVASDSSSTSSVPAVSENELPDWLRIESPESEQETIPMIQETDEAQAPVVEEILPTVSDNAIALETSGVETPSEVDDIPDWLRSASSVEPSELGSVTSVPTSATPVEAPLPSEMPAWIAALKPQDADAIAPSFGGEKSQEPIQAGEIPPWLAAMKPKEADAIQPSTPAQKIEEPVLSELPAWVTALRPKELDLPATQEPISAFQGPAILSDLPGVLPLVTALVQPHEKRQRVAPTVQPEGARVFESLLTSTAEPVSVDKPPASRKRTIRPLLYVLILLAVLVPFIVPMDAIVPITNVATESLFDSVNALPPNAPVVVSFDYDPGTAGEMDLLAKAIVRHLAQRGVKIVAVSTLETGPQVAHHVIDAVAQEDGKIKYGVDYVIVYLPGQPALKQAVTSNLLPANFKDPVVDSFLTSINFKTLRNAALIIELAGRDDVLKNWMEQVQPSVGVKMAAAVSAAVEPKARAYRGSNQLVALSSGLLGAAQYEALARQAGQALIAVNAQSIVQIVLIFIIVLGNIMQLVSRARGHKA